MKTLLSAIAHVCQAPRRARLWEWSVMEDGQRIAGGFCRTKADATNDAQAWIDQVNSRLRSNLAALAKADQYEAPVPGHPSNRNH